MEFAIEIVNRDKQYYKFVPAGIDKDSSIARIIVIQDIFIRKLSECAVARLMKDKLSNYKVYEQIFEIKDDIEEVLGEIILGGMKTQVKTSYVSYHQCLNISKQQFKSQKEKQTEIYIATKVNLPRNKFLKSQYKYIYDKKSKSIDIFDLNKLKKAQYLWVDVIGYTTREELSNKVYCKVKFENSNKWIKAYKDKLESNYVKYLYNKCLKNINLGKNDYYKEDGEYTQLGDIECKIQFFKDLTNIDNLFRLFN